MMLNLDSEVFERSYSLKLLNEAVRDASHDHIEAAQMKMRNPQ